MARFGFVGPTYASQSPNVDAQRTINWYPEIVESGAGKGPLAMYPTPGLKLFANLAGEIEVPQIFNANGRCFAMSSNLWEIASDGTTTNRGPLLPGADQISVAFNPTQMLINCVRFDGIRKLFCLVFATNALTEVPPASLVDGGFTFIGYTDGYFVGLVHDSAKFQISALFDGKTWDPIDVAQVSEFPDNLLSMLIDHREIWLWGISKSIAYYNSGDPDFPFAPIPGAFLEQGIGISTSPVRLDNSVFWVGQDERGALIAWRAQGYTPARVSNHGVEYAWSQYANISDVTTFAYQDQGHSFWVINFPSAKATWVYDVATGMWHQRGFFNTVTGQFESHRAQCHAYVFGKHLVGDRASGNIYEMNINVLTDFGNPIRRVRRSPYVSTEQQWIYHKKLQIDLEVGLGPDQAGGEADGYLSFILEDADGVLWSVTVDDGGILHTDQVADGAPKTLVIRDQSDGFMYQLGVNTDGTLRTDPVNVYTYSPGYKINMKTTPSLLQSAIQTTDGILQTVDPYLVNRPPRVMLRYSDDGCKTWSNERWHSAGSLGQYKTRVQWFRLGRSRNRVYEMVVTDPVLWRVVDAYLDADPGFAPIERLATQMRKGA